jgi:hypothetical protein
MLVCLIFFYPGLRNGKFYRKNEPTQSAGLSDYPILNAIVLIGTKYLLELEPVSAKDFLLHM